MRDYFFSSKGLSLLSVLLVLASFLCYIVGFNIATLGVILDHENPTRTQRKDTTLTEHRNTTVTVEDAGFQHVGWRLLYKCDLDSSHTQACEY